MTRDKILTYVQTSGDYGISTWQGKVTRIKKYTRSGVENKAKQFIEKSKDISGIWSRLQIWVQLNAFKHTRTLATSNILITGNFMFYLAVLDTVNNMILYQYQINVQQNGKVKRHTMYCAHSGNSEQLMHKHALVSLKVRIVNFCISWD